jgi:lipid-binding SYLF domain-containing protein
MMTGLMLGLAMLATSAGGAPGPKASSAMMLRADFTLDLSSSLFREHSRREWQPPASQSAPSKPPKRFTKTDKVIAIAAGAAAGFLVGGYIGGAITENRDNPDDDVSVLTGIALGAPIGAVIGAIIGHKLTK